MRRTVPVKSAGVPEAGLRVVNCKVFALVSPAPAACVTVLAAVIVYCEVVFTPGVVRSRTETISSVVAIPVRVIVPAPLTPVWLYTTTVADCGVSTIEALSYDGTARSGLLFESTAERTSRICDSPKTAAGMRFVVPPWPVSVRVTSFAVKRLLRPSRQYSFSTSAEEARLAMVRSRSQRS